MQHAKFLGGGRIEIGESAWPEPAAGEALLRVRACALCGSDLEERVLGVLEGLADIGLAPIRPAGADDLGNVSGEVPNGGVDLG